MAWVRLSDDFYDHPKFDRAGPLGIALFAAGLAWCNRNLSDGFIPRKAAARLLDFSDAVNDVRNADRNGVTNGGSNGGSNEGGDGESDAEDAAIAAWLARRTIRRLLDAGLWTEAEGGYHVHDYLDYQASKEQIEAGRENNAARQKAWRERRKAENQGRGDDQSNADRNGVTNGVINGTVTGAPNPNPNPNPSSTYSSVGGAGGEADADASAPTDTKPKRSDRGTRLPDDFTVTAAMKEWAATNAPSCGRGDHDAFCDYWRSVPGQKGRKRDWVATWRNWMRKEHERRAQNPRNRPQQPPPASRDAPRCSLHHMALPCDGCAGEVKAGDSGDATEILGREGPEARPDLAELLSGGAP